MKFKILLLMLFATGMYANNIEVSNISLTAQNTTDNYTLVEFDLSWENSWRLSTGPSNYDGAWVFVKWRRVGDWKHATINYVDGTAANDGHTEAAGSTIKTTPDGVGVFIHRDADGSGDVNFQSIQLRWNYGSDLVQDDDVVEVQVYAIEMVYIPEGAYPLGATGNGAEVSHFYTNTSSTKFIYNVFSETTIIVSPAIGDLYYDSNNSSAPGDKLGPIGPDFPKGYDAFWSMKYELTEDQWITFFNQLPSAQKSIHDITTGPNSKNSDLVVDRNTVSWTSGLATTSAPARAVSYLDYDDHAAYLDWAGLRFMTELEYEKMTKGPYHTDGMYASGGTIASPVNYTIVNDGQENALITNLEEGITNINGFTQGVIGPLRVGIFAASATNPTRIETGGSYYGVMELSGNLYERLISVGTPTNRAFMGDHGDGSLDANGQANVTNWPNDGAAAMRGGSFFDDSEQLLVSDRTYAGSIFPTLVPIIGARGGRTAE